MILVDVFVPAADNVYDFRLDEDVKIGLLIEEIGEMICQKEHCRMEGRMDKLLLCSMDNRNILSRDTTLAESGIKTGGKLMLL
ncbi:MAG: glutamyl-tRNA amidotransferase [Lachnospiraceae bacterium]|nr:glutamyl-tRNA amidotransferase [Lachnospiraceae bacterium]